MGRFLLFVLCIGFWSAHSQEDRKVDSLLKLAKSLVSSNPDGALVTGYKVLLITKATGNDKSIVALHSLLGNLEARKGRYDSALHHFSFNLVKGHVLKNDKWITSSLINMANVYVSQGNYEPAIKHYLAALRINERSGDKSTLRINYLCLGIAYYYYKNYDLSLSYYKKTLALDLELGEIARAAYSYNAIGVIYKETGKYTDALDYLSKTESIAQRFHDTTILSHNRANLGEIYGQLGNEQAALTNLLSAIDLQFHMNDKKGAAESLVLLGNLHQKMNRQEAAIKTYNEALNIGKEMGVKEIQKDACKGLSLAYSALGKYKQAISYQDTYVSIKDTLFQESNVRKIAEMQTEYETEKKEKENLVLASQNKIGQLELNKQRNQRNSLIALICFILVLFAFLYNRNRLKHRNKVLVEKDLRHIAVFKAQETEKARLSQELHDGVGPILSLIKLNASSLTPNDKNEKMIREIKSLASEGMKEVRNISHALMPSLLEKKGLEAALKEFIESADNGKSLSIQLDYQLNKPVSSLVEANFYRIVQEALHNTLKHAEATTASIVIGENKTHLFLSISDNGKGYEPKKTSAGNGLNNLYARVDLLKGKLQLTTGKNSGTHYLINIPIETISYVNT